MKLVAGVIVIVMALLNGCSGTKEVAETAPEKMALGWLERSAFENPEYPAFKTMYDTVTVSEEFIEPISELKKGIDVTIVLGTWCGDSKRQVPRFLKLADAAGFAPDQIRFLGVDRTKKSPDGKAETFHIEKVPTFIFLKNGSEVGRITEIPQTTMEGDVLSILADAVNK